MSEPEKWIVAPAIEDAKITEYLLNIDHPVGGPKARYFIDHGYSLERPEPFISALFEHCIEANRAKTVTTEFTVKYVYEAPLPMPDGSSSMVRSVWEYGPNDTWQRLVTAYRF